MNIFKKFVNHIKGSELTEKILLVAFVIAAGAGTTVYMTNVIKNSKQVDVGMPVAYNNQGIEFINGKKYTITDSPRFAASTLDKEDMEFVSVSKIFNEDGTEQLVHGQYHKEGFVGYSSYMYIEETGQWGAIEPDCSMLFYFFYSENLAGKLGYDTTRWNDNYPGLNEPYFDDAFYSGVTFEFSGRWVRQGNGPHLIDHLTYYEE